MSAATGHSAKLERLGDRAITVILTSPTLATAAATLGVSERTLRRWTQRPDFAARLAAARRDMLDRVHTRLVGTCDAAINALVGVAGDPTAPAAARVAAARCLLEMTVRTRSDDDTASRLDALEAALMAGARPGASARGEVDDEEEEDG